MADLDEERHLPKTTAALNVLLKRRQHTGESGLALVKKCSQEPYNVVPNVVTINTLLNKSDVTFEKGKELLAEYAQEPYNVVPDVVTISTLLNKSDVTFEKGKELLAEYAQEPYNVVPNVVTISTLLAKEISTKVASHAERSRHMKNATEIVTYYKSRIETEASHDEVIACLYLGYLFMNSNFKEAVLFAQKTLAQGPERTWSRKGLAIFGESILIWLPENHEFRRAILAVFSQHPELNFIVTQAERDKARYGDIFDAWARESIKAKIERYASGARVFHEGLRPVNTDAAREFTGPRRKK